MAKSVTKSAAVEIKAPNLQTAVMVIEGTAPYVQNKFSFKAKQKMMETQMQGSKAKSKKEREPKDFDALYAGCQHISDDGWHGIPAPAFRAAMISACRIVNFAMTRAKLAIFVEPDGFDKDDGTPLVKMTKGKPERHDSAVRNDSGVVDIRPRAMWKPGWRSEVRITFDADMFTTQDVANLLSRAGQQVGIGEGRPDSKDSTGMGWGTFRVLGDKDNA